MGPARVYNSECSSLSHHQGQRWTAKSRSAHPFVTAGFLHTAENITFSSHGTVPGAVLSQVCRQPKNGENQFQFLVGTVPSAVLCQVCRQPKNRENQFQFLVGTIPSAVLCQVCRQPKNRENQFQFLMGTIPGAVLSQVCRQPKSCHPVLFVVLF